MKWRAQTHTGKHVSKTVFACTVHLWKHTKKLLSVVPSGEGNLVIGVRRGKEMFQIWHSITFELKDIYLAAPSLIVALESLIFVAACGIFSCSMQTLR